MSCKNEVSSLKIDRDIALTLLHSEREGAQPRRALPLRKHAHARPAAYAPACGIVRSVPAHSLLCAACFMMTLRTEKPPHPSCMLLC